MVRMLLCVTALLGVVQAQFLIDYTRAVGPHKTEVIGVAYGPNFLAVAEFEAKAVIYKEHKATGTELSHGPDDTLWSIAASSDGSVVVTGVDPAKVVVWDAATGAKLREISVTTAPTSMEVTPDGKQVVVCSWMEKDAFAYDIATGAKVGTYPTNSMCAGVALTGDGATVVVADMGQPFHAFVYDRETSALRKFFNTWHLDVIRDVAVSPDGSHIVTGSQEGRVRVFDASGTVLHDCDNGVSVLQVEVTPDGSKVLYGGDGSGDVKVRSITTGEPLGVFQNPSSYYVAALDINGRGSRVAANSMTFENQVWVSKAVEWETPFHPPKPDCASVRVAGGSDFRSVRLLPGEQGVEDGRMFVHGIPASLSQGVEATAWFPQTVVSVGQQVEVTCCGGGGGCSVAVAVYHCPPCSAQSNGGYTTTLPREKLAPVQCPTAFTVRDDAVDAWVEERHQMAAFTTVVPAGSTFQLPPTTSEASHVVLFTTTTTLPSNWCGAEPASPGTGKKPSSGTPGAGGISSWVGPGRCMSRFC